MDNSMKMLLPLDIQFFAEPFDDFDLDKFDEDFEQSLSTEGDENVDNDVNPDVSEDEIEEDPQVEETTDNSEESSLEQPDLTEEQKRNAAFAQLRRERDEAAKQAAWIKKLAEENGMSVEDLQKQYEERRIAKEAEEKGVPVDVLQRLQQLEQENMQVKSSLQAKEFNEQVSSTLQKYNGTEENFKNTVEYAQQNGLFEALKSGAISFEAAYKLAHVDSMLDDARKSAVQEDLSKRKQRQTEAPIANGSGATAINDSLDDVVAADVKELLENGGF